MKVRRLNDEGLRQMSEFLDSLTTDDRQEYPSWLLGDRETSEALPANIAIEARQFPRRFEAARYLHAILSDSGLQGLERDAGLWAWLALFYFEQLCPTDKTGHRVPKDRARWIPEVDDWRKYYRHLLLGPYIIYNAHRDKPDRAMALLCQPLAAPGELVEQIASRQHFVTSNAVVAAATRLYIGPAGSRRRGAGGGGGGSPRRLARVLMQFDRTFDLHSLATDQLIELLPAEFDAFRR